MPIRNLIYLVSSIFKPTLSFLGLVFLSPFWGYVSAQINLVPNPSFEILSACPTGTGQIILATGWFAPTYTYADIFNTCAPLGSPFGVPINAAFAGPGLNYKYPKDGNGYAGIVTFNADFGYNSPWLERGYLEAKLNQTLTPGKTYYLIFFISPSKENWCVEDSPTCAVDAIGMALTQQRIDSPAHNPRGGNQLPIEIKPALEHRGSVLSDTSTWYEISGCYIGNGENYVIIGNFETDANTIANSGCANFCGPNESFNYIDEVGIYEYDPLPDTILLCTGQSVRLGHGFLDATYLWSTGSTDSVIVVDRPGRYIITTSIGGCQLSDTVVVIDPAPDIADMPHDTLTCLPLTIYIPVPGSYTWSDSSHADSLIIAAAGEYRVTVSNVCGTFTAGFEVTSRPCDCHVYMPNAFSPNGDGVNDTLQPFVTCDFSFRSVRFIIADRWGEIVYENDSEDVNSVKWDGTYRGQMLAPGTYIMLYEYVYLENGISHSNSIKGSITLLR